MKRMMAAAALAAAFSTSAFATDMPICGTCYRESIAYGDYIDLTGPGSLAGVILDKIDGRQLGAPEMTAAIFAESDKAPRPAAIGGPIGSPTYVVAPSGSVIDIGQVFGPLIEPYVNALVGSLLSLLSGWILWFLRTKLKINIDQAHADVYLRAATNQASSLIADGFVKFEANGKITVDDAGLAMAANALLSQVPNAAQHFAISPEAAAAKIVDMIPQVPAASAIAAVAHANGAQTPAPSAVATPSKIFQT